MTDTWIEQHRTDRPIAYLIEHGTATIAELAHIAGLSIDRMLADMGGLHDHGIVTRYGNKAWSLVRWEHGRSVYGRSASDDASGVDARQD